MSASVSKKFFFVVDVSNSYTKWARVQRGKLGAAHRVPTPKITATWACDWARKNSEGEIILASVVPACTARLARAWGCRVHRVHGGADLGMGIRFPHKRQIGADILANAVAARTLHGWPAIVIDFGTAVTFDVLNPQGAYHGGVIAPGLNAMTDYLHEKTALLPRIDVREPRRAVGNSTVEAMRIGAVIGYRGLVREVVGGIRKELDPRNRLRWHIIATGGQAQLVARGLPELIQKVDPRLTLQGLRILGERWILGRKK